jgi:hypothetical protein
MSRQAGAQLCPKRRSSGSRALCPNQFVLSALGNKRVEDLATVESFCALRYALCAADWSAEGTFGERTQICIWVEMLLINKGSVQFGLLLAVSQFEDADATCIPRGTQS